MGARGGVADLATVFSLAALFGWPIPRLIVREGLTDPRVLVRRSRCPFFAFDHVAQSDVEPSFASIFAWLRPGGWLMTSVQTVEAEDRVEEWLAVPMFFAGLTVPSYERLLREAGFDLELSEFREEVDPTYGPSGHQWVIARRPEPESPTPL